MRFVVGYVPQRRGLEAVHLGSTLAGGREAVLDVVVVLPDDSPTRDMYSPDRRYQQELDGQAQEWLDEALAAVPQGVSARGQVRHARTVAEGLIEAATDPEAGSPAEAIVVGGSHRSLIGEVLIGSTASSLLHAAPVPVALAPGGYPGHPAVTRFTCALGDRHGADALLETAIQAAAARSVPLRVMSLVALDPDPTANDHESSVAAEEHTDALVERARQELPAGITVSGVVGSGHDLEECVTSLDFEPAELVLFGSSRLGAPRRVFLGATAHRIARALPVPMVVVPRDYEVG
ncbi:universal stress protein [Actinomycetota bacterium]